MGIDDLKMFDFVLENYSKQMALLEAEANVYKQAIEDITRLKIITREVIKDEINGISGSSGLHSE